MRIRVGLVGFGRAWDTRHKPALRALADRYEVRAVCEQVALRAHHVAQEFNAVPVDGYRALTQRDDIDAILMLSPQWFGALPILAACDAGKAVYCAAAMDLEPDEARRIKDRVQDAGVILLGLDSMTVAGSTSASVRFNPDRNVQRFSSLRQRSPWPDTCSRLSAPLA